MENEEPSMKCEYRPVSLPNEFPGGFFVCSLKEPRKILFANAEVLRLFDCRDFGELSIHLQDNVENMLAVEDVRRVHSQMEHQLAEKGGVETEEQAEFLASIGCGRLQGFFFGKPQPLAGAFAHIKAKQIGIETRRWHPYYDKADSLIYATDEPLAIMDFTEDAFHYGRAAV